MSRAIRKEATRLNQVDPSLPFGLAQDDKGKLVGEEG